MNVLTKIVEYFTNIALATDSNKVEPEVYSWREGNLGHVYLLSNKNRKILYRITKTDKEFYQVESLNGVPEVVGTFLDLENAKKWAEKRWVDINTWIS